MNDPPTRGDPRRFFVLLGAILALILAAPFLQNVSGGRALAMLFGAAIPLAGVYTVGDNRRHVLGALFLVVPAIIANTARLVVDAPGVQWLGLIFPFVFYAYATWIVAGSVFRSREVTTDTLAGAACIYLLLGVLWWFAYMALALNDPAAFAGTGWLGADATKPPADLLYFSFVTLTTLGYGDLTPVTAQARSLAIVEAVSGVLFVAILIARLVGLYMARLSRD